MSEKLQALSTYLKKNSLSQSKELISKFEENTKPDKVIVREIREYKLSTIENSIKALNIEFKQVKKRAVSTKNTFIIKRGTNYIMVLSQDIGFTPYRDEKRVKMIEGNEAFNKTMGFMSLTEEIEKDALVMQYETPVFRSMMKHLVESVGSIKA